MADVIKKSDLFEKDLFGETIQGAENLLKTIGELKAGFNELLEANKAFLASAKINSAEDLKKFNAAIKESNEIAKQKIKVESEELRIKKSLAEALKKQKQQEDEENKIKKSGAALTKALLKEEAQRNKEKEKAAKAAEKERKENEKLNSAYFKLSAQLNDLRKKYKDLAAAEKGNTDEAKALLKEITALDTKLKDIDASVGQFQRSVGNYKESVKEALQETGLFNGELGRITKTLGEVKEKITEAAKSGQGLAKALAAGLAALAVAATLAVLNSLSDISQKLTDIKDKTADLARAVGLGAFGAGIGEATKKVNEYYTALINSRGAIRALNLEIQAASQEQEDFTEIANDATLGFKTRQEAAQKAREFEEVAAKKAIELAQLNLNVITKQIAKDEALAGLGNAKKELYDELNAKQLELNEALDKESDIIRINDTLKREIAQKALKQTINAIQAETNIKTEALKKEIESQKNQIEERRKLAKDAENINDEAFKKEIKQFKTLLNLQIDGARLLKITDGELLEAEIERLNLGEKAQKELLDIIQLRQKSILDFAETNKKLDEEELNRKIKIAQIEREIEINKQNAIVEARASDVEDNAKSQEGILNKILENENVFNSKRLKTRKILIQAGKEERAELLSEQIKVLDLQRENELKAAEASINDAKILAAEKLKIEQEYQQKKEGLLINAQKTETELAAETAKQNEAIRKKQIEIISDESQRIAGIIGDGLDQAAEKRKSALDKEIEQRSSNIDRQQALAEKGLNNTLAFEKQKQAEAELRREQEAKRDERRAKALAYFNAFAEYLKEDPNSAAFKALAQVAIAQTIAGAFKDGVENLQGPGTETSDSILARLSKGESVLTAKATRENPGLATALNEGRAEEYFKENILTEQPYNKQILALNGLTQDKTAVKELKQVNNRLASLEKAIKHKKEVNVNWDNNGALVVNEVESGIKRVIKYNKQRPKI